jgi:dolichol kinase
MSDLDFRHEILRKLVHLSSLWIVAFVYLTDTRYSLALFGGLTVALFAVEYARFSSPRFATFFLRFFGSVLRAKEKSGAFRPTGSFYFVLSAFLCVLLFDRVTASAALCILVVSDTCAALVGRRFGRRHVLDKTWEGCAAFAISAFFIVLLFVPDAAIWAAAGVAVGTALVELVCGRLRLDDNLVIPLAAGSLFYLFF